MNIIEAIRQREGSKLKDSMILNAMQELTYHFPTIKNEFEDCVRKNYNYPLIRRFTHLEDRYRLLLCCFYHAAYKHIVAYKLNLKAVRFRVAKSKNINEDKPRNSKYNCVFQTVIEMTEEKPNAPLKGYIMEYDENGVSNAKEIEVNVDDRNQLKEDVLKSIEIMDEHTLPHMYPGNLGKDGEEEYFVTYEYEFEDDIKIMIHTTEIGFDLMGLVRSDIERITGIQNIAHRDRTSI